MTDFVFDRHVPENQLDLLERVKTEFFVGNPVSIDIQLEGQSLDDNGNYILGLRAGPVIDITHLFHEMGHLAEREISKLLKKPYSGWGYTHGKYWEIAGKSGYEALTDQAVQREARVWAYQLSLQKYYNLNISVESAVSSAVYLDAFLYYKIELVRNLHYSLQNVTRLKYLAAQVEELHQTTFTIDVFKSAWQERMELL